MPDFGGSPNFASARAIQSDVRSRSVSGQHLLPEDLLFEWDAETGKIFVQGTTDEVLHSGDFPSDTAWTTATGPTINGWAGISKYIKRSGMVTATFSLGSGGATADAFFQMPAGYRPAETMYLGDDIQIGTSGILSTPNRPTTLEVAVTYPIL
jgi:hypothetical protein